MIHFLCNGKQQIIADGNPNLREYCILACSVERLDMQPLLYPFEETFHLPASVFKQYIEIEFEGHKYKAISEYDSYLSKHYGDYLKLPPLEQQISNHSYEVYWK